MKLSIALLCLFTMLSAAVDIKNYYHGGCKGGYRNYANIGPRTCASFPKYYQGAHSVRFSDVPKDAELFGWQISHRTGSGRCSYLAKRANAGSNPNYCMDFSETDERLSGSSWKNSGKAARDVAPTEDEKCTEAMDAHQLVLDDGHMYDLTKMDQDQIGSLSELAVNGTTSQALPAEFAPFEIEKDAVQSRLQDMQ